MIKSVRYLSFFVLLILNFLFIDKLYAHPLDISSNFFSIKGNNANVTTFFHSYEIEYLLSNQGILPKTIQTYYDNSPIIIDYLKKHTNFYNNLKLCSIQSVQMPQKEEYEVLTKGVEVNYSFNCPDNISQLKIEMDFFTNFQLQTNKITVYNLNNGIQNLTPSVYKVLTSKINSFSFDLNNHTIQKLKDTDGDGLTDEEEAIYKTDPNKVDTDDDNYTDYEEVVNGRDVLNPRVSPGQIHREEMPQGVIDNIKANLEGQNKPQVAPENENIQNGLLSSGYGMEYLREALKQINQYVKKTSDTNFFYIFGIVIVLGFIHAFGPGHSKSLLISYIVDKNKGFMDGLGFISIFTVTHLIDIVVLFTFTKFIFQIYDITNYMLYIQRISLGVLILFSGYLIYRSFKNIKKLPNKGLSDFGHLTLDSDQKNNRGTWLLGFVAGLAPCTFGWSIFLLLFSMGSLNLILPMILALGIGIFLCLLGIMIVTLIIRQQVYGRIKIFSTYSSLVSSIILLGLSFYLLYIII